MTKQRILIALLGCCLLATTADAATATYRWQVSDGQSVAGYTTNWTQSCGNNLGDTTALTVTTMTTAAFPCLQAGRISTAEPSPFDLLLMIRPTAYGEATDVTGGSIRWYLRDADGGSVTFRIHLGYAQGGAFTSFGFIDQTVTDSEALYILDLSAVSGTAPVGSHLATMVELQSNSNNNQARVYLADDKNTGDWSGQLTVDETASCTPTGSLAVTPGQTLNGNPIDLTTISTATGATNLIYDVYEGSCPSGATLDQLDDFAGLADGTRPNFGNWTGVNGSDGTLGWVALSGATASGTTGPSSGNPDPYVYLESSASSQTWGVDVTAGSSQFVESNVIDAGTWVLSFAFDWNMNVNGNSDASLHLDAWNGAGWDLDVNGGVINTGNNGDVWVSQGPVDLSAYTNADFKLRIRVIVGANGTLWQNDVAIDNLHITGTERVTTLFSGNQAQAQAVDTNGWIAGTKCLRITGDDANCGTPLTTAQDVFTWNALNNSTVAGTVTAASSSCSNIVITAPYTGDDNADNTLSYRFRTPSGGGAWSAPVNLPHSASPYSITMSGLAHGASYDIEVTYVDPDSVSGTNPQTISNIVVGADCTGAGTVTAVQTAGATPSLAVSAPYSFDANADNTLSYRHQIAGSGSWTSPVNLSHSPSPYTFTLAGLICGTAYDIEVTYADIDGIGSGAALQTLTNLLMNNCTTAGSAGATVDGCDRITVSAPFTGDGNGNGSTSFEQGASAGGPWTTVTGCGVVGGPSPRTCVDTGLIESTDYYYRVTTSDPDAVDGAAQQIIGPFNTGACNEPPLTPGVATAAPDSCTQITVAIPFTGDTNNNSDTTVEVNTSNSWPSTVACSGLTGPSPRSCPVASLTNATAYFFRVTHADPDGVNGANPQIVGPVLTLDCRVTPQTASANVDACDQITVSAPFGDDANADSSTAFERGPGAAGPWTTTCGSVTGPSPRSCVDAVTESSSYHYRVTFSDPDGVNGTAQQVIGPYSTPACAVNFTNVVSNTALVNSCRQITVTSAYTDDANGDGRTRVEYNTINSWPGAVECANLSGASPRQCVIFGLTPGAATYLRVTYDDPDGVDAPGVTPKSFVIGPVAVPSCGTDNAAPTLVFLSPTSGATVGGGERFKIQVYDADGLALTNPVSWSMDGGAQSTAVGVNTNYNCGAMCSVYEFDVDTTGYANGAHYLTVSATDAAGNIAVKSQAINLSNSGAAPSGDGFLMRRTHSSQLCLDCHALTTHSSQHTSDKYGSVGFECLSCHEPHGTRNIFLVRETISTPRDGDQAVTFRNTDGKADQSYATATAPGNGICEVCHTRTRNSDGTPRFRNTGESDGGKHYTTRCTACHPHSKGFSAGESEGGATCAGCHADIWDGMNGAVAKVSRHAIGNVPGVNDAFTDTSTSWSDPLGANVAADRSCLNMCHQDHIHNQPGQTEHDFNVHQDARTQGSRAVTRTAGAITGGTPDQTDFSGVGAGGGMCMSCHQSAVDASRPSLDTTAYDSSAHDFITNTVGATTYNWVYTLHDGSAFERNCTKCHTDRGDSGGGPDATVFPFGAVHFSDYPSLLAGSTNPNGAVSDFVCYNCHGNGAAGTVDRSGKDIASQVSKTYGHPTDSDAVHDSVTEENGAAFGNSLGGVARHASCLDCHDSHQARAGTHATGANTAGPPLEGAWGAELSTNPGFWVAPAAGNFTKKTIVAGVDAEATLCFKCHSSYYGTLPTSPSGGYQQTDTAREFNPDNGGPGGNDGSFHPVLASAGSNLGATSNIKAPWTRTSLMTCSDCHESNSTADPNGPHGSTAGFLLKGPNTLWSDTLVGTSSGMPGGTFCINCHNQDFTDSRFQPTGKGHKYNKHINRNGAITCFNCHSAIPHGTARPGLLVTPRSQSIGGLQVTDASPYLRLPAGNSGLQINSYPNNNTTSWAKNNCECGNSGWNH